MEYKDYYKIMGVARDASQDDVKKAYRRLARQYHPDVSDKPDAEQRFKDLGEAYAVLKDPEKRAAYDQLGANWKSGQEFRPPPDWQPGSEFSQTGFEQAGPGVFSDFFEELFGAGMHGGFSARGGGLDAQGQDHHARILINLEDAYRGATRSMNLGNRQLNVKIPKGVRKGQRIRLAGQGAAGIGRGGSGDLYLDVDFEPHPWFRIDGKDVYLDLPLTPWEAALGATIQVPTPDGRVDLAVPAGTANGSKLRLKGRGIPGTPPGHLYVVARLTLPPASDENAQQLYRKMRDEMPYNPRRYLEA